MNDGVLLVTGASRGIGTATAHLVPMQRGSGTQGVAQAIVWRLSGAASDTSMGLLDVSGAR